jgi:hypothetical protein
MIRRHIVSDSDVSELCQRIYRKHKRALDLIFEHRPDVRLEIFELVKHLRSEAAASHGISATDTSRLFIAFDDEHLRGVGERWQTVRVIPEQTAEARVREHEDLSLAAYFAVPVSNREWRPNTSS